MKLMTNERKTYKTLLRENKKLIYQLEQQEAYVQRLEDTLDELQHEVRYLNDVLATREEK